MFSDIELEILGKIKQRLFVSLWRLLCQEGKKDSYFCQNFFAQQHSVAIQMGMEGEYRERENQRRTGRKRRRDERNNACACDDF